MQMSQFDFLVIFTKCDYIKSLNGISKLQIYFLIIVNLKHKKIINLS